MDKLTLAHEFAMKLAGLKVTNKTEDIIRLGWEYADVMQAEAKKREDTSRPDVICEEKITASGRSVVIHSTNNCDCNTLK